MNSASLAFLLDVTHEQVARWVGRADTGDTTFCPQCREGILVVTEECWLPCPVCGYEPRWMGKGGEKE